MARFFESRQDRVSRETRQRETYPQREFASFDEIAEVDAAERALVNEPLTQFGRDAEDTFVRNFTGFEDEELAAPRGPVVGPPPLPSPFDIARFRRTQGLDEPDDGGGGFGLGDVGGFLGRAGRLAADSPIAAGVTAVPRSILGVGSELAQGDFSGAAGALPGAGLLRTARDPVGVIDRTVGGALETARAGSPPTQIVDLLGREREPAQTTADGVTGLLEGLRDIDRVTGLPIRTPIRQGAQTLTEPGQAFREQFALEQQGGLGFGLEGSALAEQLRRVPGIEQNVPGTDISTFDAILAAADIGLDVGGLVAAARVTPRATRGIRAFSQLTDGVPVGASIRNVGPDDDLLKQLQASIDELGQGNEVFRATDRNTGRYIRRHANDFTEDPAEAMLFNSEASARAFEEANPSSTLDFWTVRPVAGVDEAPDALRALPDRPAPQLTERPVPPSTVPVQPGAIPRAIPEAPVVPRVADQGAVPRVADEIVPPAAPASPTGITPAPRGGAGGRLPGGPPAPPRAVGAGLPGAPEPGRAPSQVTIDPLRNVPPLKPYEPSITTSPAPRGPSPDLPSGPGGVTRTRPPALPSGGPLRPRAPDLDQFTVAEEAEGSLRRFLRTVNDFAGLPRSFLASFDLSAPFRQGALDVTRGAWWRSWWPMVRALGSDSFALRRQDELLGGADTVAAAARGDPDAILQLSKAQRRAAAGVDLTRFSDEATQLTQREETFASSLADKFPGIRASNRAFATFMNEIRAAKFDNFSQRMDRYVADGALTPAQRTENLREMAKWVNIGTGRGDLPEAVATNDLLVAANRVFFSPRLQISRMQALGEALRTVNPNSSLSRQMRLEIARDIAGFVGGGIGALAIMDAAGWIEVELDPRSTDFGKGRVPLTGQRYDPWAGFQPIARYTAQILSGQRKNSVTGEVTDIEGNPIEAGLGTGLRFIRGKLGPGIPTLLVDSATGETVIGDPVDLTDPESAREQLGRQFIPISAEDIITGANAEGLIGALKSAPAIVGVGFNQYQQPADVKDAVALEQYGQLYKQLNRGQQRIVDEDQRVVAKFEEYQRGEDPDDLSRDDTSALFDQHERSRERLEADLRAKLEGGVSGEGLRAAITDFKSDMFISAEAIFEGPLSESFDQLDPDEAPIEDVLAELYWSAAAPESVTAAGDVRIDYDTRDAIRADVLDRAVEQGVDFNYITGRGEGTYRGKRYDDETVREAVFAFEEFRDRLQNTGFFDLRDEAWAQFRSQHFDALGGITDYWAWRDAEVLDHTQRFIDQGEAPPIARDRAESLVSQYATVTQFNEFYRTQFRHNWVVDNRELAQQAVGFEYLQPDKAEGKFLSEVGEQAGGFQPLDISGGRGIPQAPSFSGAIDISR